MSDDVQHPGGGRDDDDPFGGIPAELRAMFEQLSGGDIQQFASQLAGSVGASRRPDGPVDWTLAQRVALQVAAEEDRSPTEAERRRAHDAFDLAEHWLDETSLPALPDAGRLAVVSRQEWVNTALGALRPMVEPVANASVDALIGLAGQQLGQLGDPSSIEDLGIELPPGLSDVFARVMGGDLSDMLRPAAAMMTGLQVGQVVGRLAHQLFGQYDLGIPTASRNTAHLLAVNIADVFEGYGIDETEVAVVLAVNEAAHRRIFHSVGWLESHIRRLVEEFAAGITVDPDRLAGLADELLVGLDPDDPEALSEAMNRAARFRLEPSEAQQRILERLQTITSLTGAWARAEAQRAIAGRIPALGRIAEVLLRRRATRGDGEELLAGLLGLDLRAADESIGQAFIDNVTDTLGAGALFRILAHPENLPEPDELAHPDRWMLRTSGQVDLETAVPDDLSALLDSADDAPHEASAEQRTLRQPPTGDTPESTPQESDDHPGDDDGTDTPTGGT
ncbi:MAG: zinc-dependent metalloprotease [Nitriliruptoraceae bacterium]